MSKSVELIRKDVVLKRLELLRAEMSTSKVRAVSRCICAVMDTTPVDAVRVVRCKRCKFFAIDRKTNRGMCIRMGEVRPDGCVWGGLAADDDHFCGYGVELDGGALDE